jgi:uncharacterized protein (TIGR03083 family)
MDEDAVWQVIHRERSQLADLLETLGPDEWEHPSLCADWSVRDVAAHVIGAAELTLGRAVVEVIRARGSLPKAVHDAAKRRAGRPTKQIIADFRRLDGSRHVLPGTTYRDALVDVLVHFQDIAVPLGRDHQMPLGPAHEAVQHAWRSVAFRAKRRLSGFRLEATDTDWTAGEGQTLRGPVQALLLLVTGRTAALALLEGDGLPALRRRIQAGW